MNAPFLCSRNCKASGGHFAFRNSGKFRKNTVVPNGWSTKDQKGRFSNYFCKKCHDEARKLRGAEAQKPQLREKNPQQLKGSMIESGS